MLCSDTFGLDLSQCIVRISIKLRVVLVSEFRISVSFRIDLGVTCQP